MPKPVGEMTLAEVGDELNNVVTESRNLLEKAEKEGRTRETLLPAEMERINRLSEQITPLNTRKKSLQDFMASLGVMDRTSQELDTPNPGRTPAQQTRQENIADEIIWNTRSNQKHLQRRYSNPSGAQHSAAYNKEFKQFLKTGKGGPLMAGSIGMNVSDDERGGFFVVGEAFATEMLKNVDDQVFIQGMSTVIMMPPGAQSYGIRVRRAKANSFRWSEENDDISDTKDTSLKYGKRVMQPNWLAGSCVISKELIRNYPGAESMVIQELGINASEILEQAYLYADGNQKPLGLLVANADGIDTDRDYTTTSTADFTFDDFVAMKFNLKIKYRSNAHWMFHRYILRDICLLKDGEGQYLWQPSRQVGEPDRILGLPLTESEWMPSAKTTGTYFALLGDFQYYYVLWDMAMQMQRLAELRAHTNEYEYLFRCKVDAQPILPEAFVRGALG
jgi:HK97 family phage major capsid protein